MVKNLEDLGPEALGTCKIRKMEQSLRAQDSIEAKKVHAQFKEDPVRM